MRLYEDVVEPVRVQGYASVFSADYRIDGGSAWERIAPGAFVFGAARPVFLAIAHLHDRRYAWTGDRSLSLWQDGHGLAFEATAAWDAAGLTLVKGIRRGEFTGMSIGFAQRDAETVVAHGREVEPVRRAEVDEISWTWAPANPHTACWLDDDPVDAHPAHVALARARWQVGRMANRLAAARRLRARAAPRASARAAKPTVPASVERLLAMAAARGLLDQDGCRWTPTATRPGSAFPEAHRARRRRGCPQ